jgi:hypothetical protein
MRIEVLVVTKGHPFDRNAFLTMFDAMPGVEPTLVDQPAAQMVLQPEHAADYDAVLFYDMSGIPGVGLDHDGAGPGGEPPLRYRRAIEALLERGTGLVLLNHATVSWPNWPLWRRVSGSSFMLRAGELAGVQVPGSGYRGGHGPLPNPTFRLVPQCEHPVLEGLEAGFELTDELYLKTPGFEAAVVPLLRGDYPFVAEHFSPPPLAPAAERSSWTHPPGSDLLLWAHAVGRAPVVASDLGDGPSAYGNPGFQRLVGNALRWVASPAARDWAQDRGARALAPQS